MKNSIICANTYYEVNEIVEDIFSDLKYVVLRTPIIVKHTRRTVPFSLCEYVQLLCVAPGDSDYFKTYQEMSNEDKVNFIKNNTGRLLEFASYGIHTDNVYLQFSKYETLDLKSKVSSDLIKEISKRYKGVLTVPVLMGYSSKDNNIPYVDTDVLEIIKI